MKISKSDNQYYGRYVERGIVDCLNGTTIQNYENYDFPQEHLIEMNNDIQIISNYLGDKEAQYIGNHTNTESGDLIVDNQIIELKYTEGSLGTYFNTSTEIVRHIGFITFSDFLKEKGYYDALRDMGIEVNKNNVSPVSITASKSIRHNQADLYKKIIKVEKSYRSAYASSLFNFLENNQEARLQLIEDLITKKVAHKAMPDRLIVFSHTDKWLREFSKQDILSCLNNNGMSLSGSTIKISGAHFTLGWQNGTGLNNPTIRVFLEE